MINEVGQTLRISILTPSKIKFSKMTRYLGMTLIVLAAFSMNDSHALEDKRSIINTLAGIAGNAWSAFLPDSTRQTCRSLGFRDVGESKASFLDSLVPTQLANMMGLSHGAVFPDETQAVFCKQAGMIKDQPQQDVFVQTGGPPPYDYNHDIPDDVPFKK